MAESGRPMFPARSGQAFETWQVAAVRLSVWFPEHGKPTRQWVVVCYQEGSRQVAASETGSQEAIPRLLETVLSQAGWRWRSRPARVEVTDSELARTLEDLLASEGVTVETVAALPELTEVTNALIDDMTADDPRPSPLTGDGVTVERLRAFALAAADLLASPVWRHLTGYDLIEVESPVIEGFRCFIASRSGRATLHGLRFFPSRAAYDQIMDPELKTRHDLDEPFWTLDFEPAWEAPPNDLDLWERFALPWAGDDLSPVAYLLDPDNLQRPNSRQLAFLEGLMSALAATSEQDLDSGRWKKQVSTADGTLQLKLFLPGVLDPDGELPGRPFAPWAATERTMREVHRLIEGKEFASLEEANRFLSHAVEQGLPQRVPDTPEESAEELVGQAWETPGRRAVLLARQALEIWPDCADAYNVLAVRAPDDATAHSLYSQAIAAGKRALEPEVFEEHAGHFWGFLEGRPYMRAVEGAAETLRGLGRLDEAIDHYREMLRLNTNDNQGARYTLVNVLIEANRDAEAEQLLAAYPEDGALMAFPRALLRFRREGATFEARRCFKQAQRENRFVPGLLLGYGSLPPPSSTYSPGREDEAGFYWLLSHGTWEQTPGALDWLREIAAPPSHPPGKGRPGGARRKKKGRRARK